jgi:protein gp37
VNKTPIEWTDYTWNPIRARLKGSADAIPGSRIQPTIATKPRTGTFCTRISPGCTHCYASVINKRFGNGLEYTVPNLARVEFFLDDRMLYEPILRKKPARIFVGDMFDLFHESIPAEFIAEVLRVALKTPRHTFQFLTKRAERMRNLVNRAQEHWGVSFGEHMWFGVSVEDQPRADERIPLLRHTTAAVRFLSIEPQLENVYIPSLLAAHIDWVICGGESGPGARPFNLVWAESLREQCRTAGVPFFMKQVGSVPMWSEDYWRSRPNSRILNAHNANRVPAGFVPLLMNDRKGGNLKEWPAELQVREFPSQKAEVVSA